MPTDQIQGGSRISIEEVARGRQQTYHLPRRQRANIQKVYWQVTDRYRRPHNEIGHWGFHKPTGGPNFLPRLKTNRCCMGNFGHLRVQRCHHASRLPHRGPPLIYYQFCKARCHWDFMSEGHPAHFTASEYKDTVGSSRLC